jgi:hypothetical protein
MHVACRAALRSVLWACNGWVDVRPRTRLRGQRGRGRAHREHSGATGARGWYGPSGQQSVLSCEAPALCVGLLSVVVTELAMTSFERGTCRADAKHELGLVAMSTPSSSLIAGLHLILRVYIMYGAPARMLLQHSHDWLRGLGR